MMKDVRRKVCAEKNEMSGREHSGSECFGKPTLEMMTNYDDEYFGSMCTYSVQLLALDSIDHFSHISFSV
jgi:uncharacterized protein YqfB (UPF0267 family)